MQTEDKVSSHYKNTHLLTAITQGLARLGKDLTTVTLDDLSIVDEFHIGGRTATKKILDQLNLFDNCHILDIGCGIGGASRFAAHTYKSHVTGIDLTSEYIETGRAICAWLGLENQVTLHQGSALSMPFDEQTFDAAYMMHVGMNIKNKEQLFKEINRVLTSGSYFGVYDVMQTGDGDLNFPVPWANTQEISALSNIEQYKNALHLAGFEIIAEENRRLFALEFFAEQQAKISNLKKLPALGLHLVMGKETPIKIKHVVEGFSSGYIAPIELIVKKL